MNIMMQEMSHTILIDSEISARSRILPIIFCAREYISRPLLSVSQYKLVKAIKCHLDAIVYHISFYYCAVGKKLYEHHEQFSFNQADAPLKW
jgi:hypothetical protein